MEGWYEEGLSLLDYRAGALSTVAQVQVKTLSQLATRLQKQASEGEESEGAGEGEGKGPHRRSSTGMSAGRKDYVQTVEYLSHRRALSNVSHVSHLPRSDGSGGGGGRGVCGEVGMGSCIEVV